MAEAETPRGAIARAARILGALADAPGDLPLAEVARRAACSKPTAHRILADLIAANLVAQNPHDRGYRLGTALAAMGRAAARLDVAASAAPALTRLAALSEDTVFVSVPEGAIAVCVERVVGSFPIRTLTLERGDIRPLGVGAGSLALYCAMPEALRRAACRRNGDWLGEYGAFDEPTLERLREAFLEKGYALNRGGIVPGMSAVGVPVVTRDGTVVAALSIAAINERMTTDRIETLLVPALEREAARLARRLEPLTREESAA